ncbi:hypothetical protein ACFUN7_14090 [Streptomyces sp. NPDC057236]|uniref:hypothetical protein n=1 Tax=Streptomyces sp. NPDC057236 TaxID=3346059 RepID=UPI0036426F7B
MHSRAVRTPPWRARRTHRTALVAAITTAAVVIAAAPGLAATPKPVLPEPESPWTEPTEVEAPATPVGSTKPPASRAEAEPSAEVAAWRTAQEARAAGEDTTARTAGKGSTARAAAAAETAYVPEGQGEVPWHRILDTRLNDALVARVNVSDGNLMLAATDFDIAGALKSGAKTVGCWAKPTPGCVAACYTTNSILDEDGSDWSEEIGDLWACADPTGGFIPD